MANAEHLEILKLGVKKWNTWRSENENIRPNLSEANLMGVDLSHANLSETNLSRTDLSHSKLANANLFGTNLLNVNLNHAILSHANLTSAWMVGAILTESSLASADLSGANLPGANLSKAKLFQTTLIDADLTGAFIGRTVFGLTDLSTCIGLETVKVHNPCIIDFQTLRVSKNLSKDFLTKIGIPQLLIDYLPDFYDPALMIYPAFLSYSWADKGFVSTLYEALTKKGVTVWLDEREMKPGDNIHDSIADAIKYYDKLILVCSENALNSWWVEKELERVHEKERQMQKQHGKKFRLVIPIMIDNQILSTEGDIFDTLKSSKIGDFTAWQDESKFEKALKELVDALNANRPDIKPPSFL